MRKRKGKRPVVVSGDIAYVPLTKGKVAVIDATDVPLVDKWNWRVMHKDRKDFYAARGIVQENGRFHSLMLHRFLLGVTNPKTFVDHINHDTLDNRRINLRACTSMESTWNARAHRRNTSGFKGVGMYRGQGKNSHLAYYRVYLSVGGVVYRKHGFKTAEEAFAYRNEVLSKYHGEFYCSERLV